jgi:hypothetical protein
LRIFEQEYVDCEWYFCNGVGNIVTCLGDWDAGLDWWIDLLTTYRS